MIVTIGLCGRLDPLCLVAALFPPLCVVSTLLLWAYLSLYLCKSSWLQIYGVHKPQEITVKELLLPMITFFTCSERKSREENTSWWANLAKGVEMILTIFPHTTNFIKIALNWSLSFQVKEKLVLNVLLEIPRTFQKFLKVPYGIFDTFRLSQN